MHLIVADPYPIPDLRPSAIQSLQNADALAAAGARVTLVTPMPKAGVDAVQILGRPLHSNLRLLHFPDLRRRWFFPFRSNRLFFRRVAEAIPNLGADALYIRNLKLADYLLEGRCATPVFFETHELFAQSFSEAHDLRRWRNRRKHALLQQREARVYRHARGLIAITATLRDDIHARYPATAPAHVAPDGVDLTLAAAPRNPGPDVGKRPIYLYLGSLHPWKGVPVLIEAMAKVSRGELWIAGGTPERVAELDAQCCRLGVQGKVRLLGSVPPASRFDVIAAADVCLLPSSSTSIGSRYTSPLKLFEYMAMGKAIIAADLPALREVLLDERNALLVPVADPVAMAAAMERLGGDAGMRRELGRAAGELAPRYSWEVRAQELLAWMTECLAKARN